LKDPVFRCYADLSKLTREGAIVKHEDERLKPMGTASVADSWRRIEAWLAEHLPEVKESLRPGVTKRDLNKFEKALERPLPEDVRESWLIHDGQGQYPNQSFYLHIGLLFGYDLNPLTSKHGLAPMSVLGEWSWSWDGPTLNPFTKERRVLDPKPMLDWASWGERAQDEDEPADGVDSGACRPSFPAGAIRRRLIHTGWLPLATMVESDFLGVDLAPGPKGVVGQVITYGRHTEVYCVLAMSWAQFLSDVADELEAGNFAIDPRQSFGEFRMLRPRRGSLHWNAKEWSAAKLARKMLE